MPTDPPQVFGVTQPPPVSPKKKGGKGMLIGILLFFILTLPVAIYYGTQQYTQITERRSRATLIYNYQCTTAAACTNVLHGTSVTPFANSMCDPCRPGGSLYATKPTCCQTSQYVTPIPTRTPTRAATAIPTRTPTSGTKAALWQHCTRDADCLSNFCGATSQCVQATSNGKCPRCATIPAPDGDPCGCSNACNNTRCTGATGAATPTPTGATIIQRGCVDGTLISVGQCVICSHGGIMTCAGPSGGSGGDPCTVKYSDNTIKSVTCDEANMIRCNCGGDAWVGGRRGVNCTQLCACAGISCDQCTPTPQNTDHPRSTNTPTPTGTSGPTNTPEVTNTPEPTNTPEVTNTPEPTSTPTPGNTSAPGTCDASCDTDSSCESGLLCYSTTGVKRCRKEACPDRANCECPIAENPTPTTRYYQPTQPLRERVIAEAPVATATQRPTPKVPVSGIIDVKAIIITIGSVLLLTLGLLL